MAQERRGLGADAEAREGQEVGEGGMRPVVVDWVDPVYHDIWEPLDSMAPVSGMRCKSIGWLREEPGYITVIPHLDADETQARGGITIPRRCVERVRGVDTKDGARSIQQPWRAGSQARSSRQPR